MCKDGKSDNNISPAIKEKSKLSEKEWVEYTKQIWDIAIPNKKDIAFGTHSAIMLPRNCQTIYTAFFFYWLILLSDLPSFT